jgi:hypothetical protein
MAGVGQKGLETHVDVWVIKFQFDTEAAVPEPLLDRVENARRYLDALPGNRGVFMRRESDSCFTLTSAWPAAEVADASLGRGAVNEELAMVLGPLTDVPAVVTAEV